MNYAILIEADPSNTLGGSCRRDIRNMATALCQRCGFKPENISIGLNKPTVGNDNHRYFNSLYMVQEISFILNKKPKLLVVFISGHGYSVKDTDGDEIDGKDEAINVGRLVKDDEIYNLLVRNQDIDMVLIADTCHSGTMFDLPLVYNGKWSNNTRRRDKLKCKALALGGCSDSQLSMCDIGEKVGYGGSLTIALLECANALEDVLNFRVDKAYNLMKTRLLMLRQTLVVSSSIPL